MTGIKLRKMMTGTLTLMNLMYQNLLAKKQPLKKLAKEKMKMMILK
jgi:hypothetical protein